MLEEEKKEKLKDRVRPGIPRKNGEKGAKGSSVVGKKGAVLTATCTVFFHLQQATGRGGV